MGELAGSIKTSEVFDEMTSTNDWGMRNCASADRLPALCIADRQTSGRGREGRSWFSPAGQNVYLSLVMPFLSAPNCLQGLSLVMALAVAEALNSIDVNVKLKWPNDILLNGKKLAGLLIETKLSAQNICVVVGLGLNVAMTKSSVEAIDQPWTSLVAERPELDISRNALVALLVSHMLRMFKQFQEQGFQSFHEQWQQWDYLMGKRISYTREKITAEGLVQGIAEDASLLITSSHGTKRLYVAETPIRIIS